MTDYEKIYADSILSEYSPKNTSKSQALHKLDSKARKPAYIFTYTFGVIAALVMGLGMCLSMGVIGDGSNIAFIVGIIIGILGIAMALVNYPILKKILENGKRKYAQDILRLASEIKSDK